MINKLSYHPGSFPILNFFLFIACCSLAAAQTNGNKPSKTEAELMQLERDGRWQIVAGHCTRIREPHIPY